MPRIIPIIGHTVCGFCFLISIFGAIVYHAPRLRIYIYVMTHATLLYDAGPLLCLVFSKNCLLSFCDTPFC